MISDKSYKLINLPSADSTNDEVKRLKNANSSSESTEEYIVTATHQTAGKGRLGRSFLSDFGGLYMSLSHTPEVSPESTMHYTALCAMAVRRAILAVGEIETDIKWPNDIYLNGKKICGILVEAVHTGTGFYMVFGIGINLENNVSEHVPIASSIFELTGKHIDKNELLESVKSNLLKYLNENPSGFENCIKEYEATCMTIGSKITATNGVYGTAVGVDERANLNVLQENGECVKVFSGEAGIS